jgi:membrane glycosyltransferase
MPAAPGPAPVAGAVGPALPNLTPSSPGHRADERRLAWLMAVSVSGGGGIGWLIWSAQTPLAGIWWAQAAIAVCGGIMAIKTVQDLILGAIGTWCILNRQGPCARLPPWNPPPRSADTDNHHLLGVLCFMRHEDPSVYGTTLLKTGDGLVAAGIAHCADLFMCSDSADPQRIAEERQVRSELEQRFAGTGMRVYHRIRSWKGEAKYGNFIDIVLSHGGAYPFLLQLDADGSIDGHGVRLMLGRMVEESDLALIRVATRIIPGRTWFTRFQAFASAGYGPITALGTAWLARHASYYWGHNAIVRTAAVAAIRLPPALPLLWSKPRPLTSHDIAEGCLLGGRGWRTRVVAGDDVSAEEGVPPGPLECLIRDARWSGGDLQAFWAIGLSPALRWTGRWILFTAWAGYAVNVLLWGWILLVVLIGSMSPVLGWVIEDEMGHLALASSLSLDLLTVWMIVAAVVPKVIGWRIACFNQQPQALRMALWEFVWSALTAPVVSLAHARFTIMNLFTKVSWGVQMRSDDVMPPARDIIVPLLPTVIFGVVLAGLTWISPFGGSVIMWWTCVSLILAPATIAWLRRPLPA